MQKYVVLKYKKIITITKIEKYHLHFFTIYIYTILSIAVDKNNVTNVIYFFKL